MRIWLVSVVSGFMLSIWLFTGAVAAQEDTENLLYLDLEAGRVVIQMRPDLAPKHVERIKILAREGFYDGLKFHRVLDGFVAQAGKPGDGSGKSDYHDLRAEFNRQSFLRGAVGMARNSDHPDTANSQFFICLENSQSLDGNYTYWGHVIEGMKYVDKIKRGDPPRNPDIIVRMQLAADAVTAGASAPAADDGEQLEAIEEQEQDDDSDWFDDLFGWIDEGEPESAASGAGGDEAVPQEIESEVLPEEAAESKQAPEQKPEPAADEGEQLEAIEEQEQEQDGDGDWFDDLFGWIDKGEPESAASGAGGDEAVPQEIEREAPPEQAAEPEPEPAADEAEPAGSDDDEGFDLFDEIRSWF